MLHAYAIADLAATPELAGLAGADLRTVGTDAPFAVVSEHARLPARLDEGDLWAHEAVVEALMGRAAVLPMRFDASVADEATLLRVLEQRRDEFMALLAAVRGAVELGVRARLGDEDAEENDGAEASEGRGGPGTTYLLTRARHQRRAAAGVSRIHEPLAALSRRSKQSVVDLGPGLLKAAYLVDRDRVDAFRARVDQLDSELGNGRIVCTGPWPPYSFSAEERA